MKSKPILGYPRSVQEKRAVEGWENEGCEIPNIPTLQSGATSPVGVCPVVSAHSVAVRFHGLLTIYRMSPSLASKSSDVWLGALGATVLIWLGERLFLFYAVNFAHFNVHYGALGGIVAFMVWLYLSRYVGVLGVLFCAAQPEVRENTNGHSEKRPE